jgi:hypothetical protein
MRRITLSLAICVALTASGRCGDDNPTGTVRGMVGQETLCEGHARAGCPQVVSPCARLSDTPYYDGYYVGGGAAVHGQPRCPCEGTWGWDYAGLIPKFIGLTWWHGEHKQGSGGAYATDHKK